MDIKTDKEFLGYLNKTCQPVDDRAIHKYKTVQGCRYCKYFRKAKNGYCLFYKGDKPCIMTCIVQCRMKQIKKPGDKHIYRFYYKNKKII